MSSLNYKVRKPPGSRQQQIATHPHYDYLAPRPASGYAQYYLNGRNMRVGQLVYKMRANGLTAEQAAVDMDLPIQQIREALAYYQVNRTLVEREAEEDKRRLHIAGVYIESGDLSG